MKVELIDYMGSDNAVVDAARVSFSKHHDKYSDADNAKLISYLADHQHWSPFAHQTIKLNIKAPIFVARQLVKHQVGFAWNEVSRRYVDDTPEFYIPDYWRKRADNIKQGSSSERVYLSPMLDMETESGCVHTPVELYQAAKDCYEALLEIGVCPEQARMVLPQAMYTEWIWTGSLFAWSRMYNLRTDSHTQLETQQIAFLIGEAIEPLFPKSWKALTK